tara:strand:+ start:1220 stop:1765 length:546 start_codon:yes stop_codon:yes gene_type:complete
MNLAETIIPKSDQLNADDLITGTITIKVTAIKGSNEPQQPVSIHYEGDNGKPYKPCKSMRRVLVSAWGANGLEYVGKSMTLYRDNSVAFGGIQVGGIRISHLSHIDNDMTLALTVSRASRKPYLVKRLEVAQPKAKAELTPTHPKWEAAKKAVSEGSTNIDAIRNNYTLSDINAELLTSKN